MRTFKLNRLEDESGISGTGRIAEGVEFANGVVVLHWLTRHSSVAFYQNISDVTEIHGHHGKTIVEWDELVRD